MHYRSRLYGPSSGIQVRCMSEWHRVDLVHLDPKALQMVSVSTQMVEIFLSCA